MKMAGKELRTANISSNLLEQSIQFESDAVHDLEGNIENYLSIFRNNDAAEINTTKQSLILKPIARQKSNLLAEAIKSQPVFEEDLKKNEKKSQKGNIKQRDYSEELEDVTNQNSVIKSARGQPNYLSGLQQTPVLVKVVSSSAKNQQQQIKKLDPKDFNSLKEESIFEKEDVKEEIHMIGIKDIEGQVSKNDKFIMQNFSKSTKIQPKKLNSASSDDEVEELKPEDNNGIRIESARGEKTSTQKILFGGIDIFENSNNEKTTNIDDFTDNFTQASTFNNKLVEAKETPDLFLKSEDNQTEQQNNKMKQVMMALPPLNLNNKSSLEKEDDSALWILDKLDSDNNMGRRTFKKQNRSTIVESSNSFSKSRTPGVVQSTDIKGVFIQSTTPVQKGRAGNCSIVDDIKTINEEEEHNFQSCDKNFQLVEDIRLDTIVSPISQRYIENTNVNMDFGDLSGVHNISHYSNSIVQNINSKNRHLDIVDGQDNIQEDRHQDIDYYEAEGKLERMDSGQVLQEITPVIDQKIKNNYLSSVDQEDLSYYENMNQFNRDILEKSMNKTNEMIRMSQELNMSHKSIQGQNGEEYLQDFIGNRSEERRVGKEC